jgi:aryl-alcohol dehydrogenase-like predicted oxidoreductase
MQMRTYGSTKEKLSVIGFAGIIVMNETPAEADRYVAEALDEGVNYFDVAPSYGNAQERLGPALAGRRNRIFLACKTGKRTRDEALAELHESLRLLQTDHFDLYQMHSMTTREDVETAMGPGGVMEALLQARTDGKIRHIGFSAHSDEAALALLDLYPFESVLMPFNWMTYLREGFGKPTLEKASAMGVTLLALKALARGAWPESLPPEQRPYPKCWYQPIEDPAQADLALRFTLSLPITAAITPGDIRMFRLAIRTVANFHPISDAEISQLMHMDPDMKPIFK